MRFPRPLIPTLGAKEAIDASLAIHCPSPSIPHGRRQCACSGTPRLSDGRCRRISRSAAAITAVLRGTSDSRLTGRTSRHSPRVLFLSLLLGEAMGDTFPILHTVHPLLHQLIFFCLVEGIARGEEPGTWLRIDALLGFLFEPADL